MDLVPHSISLWSPWRVSVDLRQDDGAILIAFRVLGDVDQLLLPMAGGAVRTDELWRTTCFELFVADPDGAGYVEYNFAPSGAWAAYRFDACRKGMRAAAMTGDPEVTVFRDAGSVEIGVRMPWPGDGRRFGCAAVLEQSDGAKAYHALAHGADKPDFHDPACFVGRLGGKDAR
jgi:hypothetical protein